MESNGRFSDIKRQSIELRLQLIRLEQEKLLLQQELLKCNVQDRTHTTSETSTEQITNPTQWGVTSFSTSTLSGLTNKPVLQIQQDLYNQTPSKVSPRQQGSFAQDIQSHLKKINLEKTQTTETSPKSDKKNSNSNALGRRSYVGKKKNEIPKKRQSTISGEKSSPMRTRSKEDSFMVDLTNDSESDIELDTMLKKRKMVNEVNDPRTPKKRITSQEFSSFTGKRTPHKTSPVVLMDDIPANTIEVTADETMAKLDDGKENEKNEKNRPEITKEAVNEEYENRLKYLYDGPPIFEKGRKFGMEAVKSFLIAVGDMEPDSNLIREPKDLNPRRDYRIIQKPDDFTINLGKGNIEKTPTRTKTSPELISSKSTPTKTKTSHVLISSKSTPTKTKTSHGLISSKSTPTSTALIPYESRSEPSRLTPVVIIESPKRISSSTRKRTDDRSWAKLKSNESKLIKTNDFEKVKKLFDSVDFNCRWRGCNRNTPLKGLESLSQHLREEHRNDTRILTNNSTVFMCKFPACQMRNRSFGFRTALYEHFEDAHLRPIRLMCFQNKCERVFASEELAALHMLQDHPELFKNV